MKRPGGLQKGAETHQRRSNPAASSLDDLPDEAGGV